MHGVAPNNRPSASGALAGLALRDAAANALATLQTAPPSALPGGSALARDAATFAAAAKQAGAPAVNACPASCLDLGSFYTVFEAPSPCACAGAAGAAAMLGAAAGAWRALVHALAALAAMGLACLLLAANLAAQFAHARRDLAERRRRYAAGEAAAAAYSSAAAEQRGAAPRDGGAAMVFTANPAYRVSPDKYPASSAGGAGAGAGNGAGNGGGRGGGGGGGGYADTAGARVDTEATSTSTAAGGGAGGGRAAAYAPLPEAVVNASAGASAAIDALEREAAAAAGLADGHAGLISELLAPPPADAGPLPIAPAAPRQPPQYQQQSGGGGGGAQQAYASTAQRYAAYRLRAAQGESFVFCPCVCGRGGGKSRRSAQMSLHIDTSTQHKQTTRSLMPPPAANAANTKGSAERSQWLR